MTALRLLLQATAGCSLLLSSAALAQQGYVIVDTGQLDCYGDQGFILPPAAGQAFHGQDAQYSGAQAEYLDNGDGTVSDLNTGLMWQQAIDFDALRTWVEAEPYADALVLAGYDDWRVPTTKELYSLMDFRGSSSANPPVPYIDTTYFDFEYPDLASGLRPIDVQFWSSDAYVGTTMNGNETAFGVNFADGRIKGYPASTQPTGPAMARHVRCVRGSQVYGANDFVDNGDGTITDRATGLMWAAADSVGPVSWEAALAAGEGSTLAGHADWRLPNAKELQSLVDYSRAPDATVPAQVGAAIDPIFTVNDPTAWCWSSTTHLDAPLNGNKSWAVYVCFGLATGWMEQPPNSGNYNLLNVHGAGSQRSDPKSGDPASYPHGFGPQGDVIRIQNSIRLVRSAATCGGSTVSYCPSKATSSGCQPSIGATGQASTTASSGFAVAVVEVEPHKAGILFYSVHGAAALPFQGGVRCMVGPVRRTPVQNSGSTGAPNCGGVLSLDLNATGVSALIGAGNEGYMQAWFRDFQSSSGTGLSDALKFTVCQ